MGTGWGALSLSGLVHLQDTLMLALIEITQKDAYCEYLKKTDEINIENSGFYCNEVCGRLD